jgi:hypothetical protein
MFRSICKLSVVHAIIIILVLGVHGAIVKEDEHDHVSKLRFSSFTLKLIPKSIEFIEIERQEALHRC